MSKLPSIASIAMILAISATGEAFAHAHLKTTTPDDKASVSSPSELDLTFTEELNLKFSGVKVTGPDKKDVKLGDPSLKAGDKVLSVPVPGTLPSGEYTVDWHVLSTDGHKTGGTYGFTVKP